MDINLFSRYVNLLNIDNDKSSYLLNIYDTISNSTIYDSFLDIIELYIDKDNFDVDEVFSRLTKFADESKIHIYTVHLVYLLFVFEKVEKLYEINNIPYDFFVGALKDIGYKVIECTLVKNVIGTFVLGWFTHYLKLDLIAIGRLQYELTTSPYDYKCIKKGDKCLSVHIPRTGGPLLPNDVDDSFKKAFEYFEDEYNTLEGIPLKIHSWLVYPKTVELTSKTSNIRDFASRFEIIETSDDSDYSEIWRLFDVNFDGDFDHLPNNTSLRRNYIEHFKKGGKFGAGCGMLFIKSKRG